ncbi:MAG: hypothetical protein HOW73_34170 [Polyangiaceae bacterium]|nr:hypothetical protein [Polyangiaceae bacterium]
MALTFTVAGISPAKKEPPSPLAEVAEVAALAVVAADAAALAVAATVAVAVAVDVAADVEVARAEAERGALLFEAEAEEPVSPAGSVQAAAAMTMSGRSFFTSPALSTVRARINP